MTDNEIVNCKNCIHKIICIFHNDSGTSAKKCVDFIDKDLINRQKAEIKEWKRVVETWVEQHEKDKAEIERLKRRLVVYEPLVDSGLFSQMLLEQKEKAEAFAKNWKAEAKAEVYREFAERLKELIKKYSVGNGLTQLRNSHVDNLLKELVGEDDG